MSVEINVRRLDARDESAWRTLWAAYCQFYEAAIDADVTRHTWDRLMLGASTLRAIVAESSRDGVIAIGHYVLHENTWEMTPVCYLEDLFVAPHFRAAGVGQQMIDWLVAEMTREGWSRLYWMTRENNYRARGLYDKYATSDGFVRYVVKPMK